MPPPTAKYSTTAVVVALAHGAEVGQYVCDAAGIRCQERDPVSGTILLPLNYLLFVRKQRGSEGVRRGT